MPCSQENIFTDVEEVCLSVDAVKWGGSDAGAIAVVAVCSSAADDDISWIMFSATHAPHAPVCLFCKSSCLSELKGPFLLPEFARGDLTSLEIS